MTNANEQNTERQIVIFEHDLIAINTVIDEWQQLSRTCHAIATDPTLGPQIERLNTAASVMPLTMTGSTKAEDISLALTTILEWAELVKHSRPINSDHTLLPQIARLNAIASCKIAQLCKEKSIKKAAVVSAAPGKIAERIYKPDEINAILEATNVKIAFAPDISPRKN